MAHSIFQFIDPFHPCFPSKSRREAGVQNHAVNCRAPLGVGRTAQKRQLPSVAGQRTAGELRPWPAPTPTPMCHAVSFTLDPRHAVETIATSSKALRALPAPPSWNKVSGTWGAWCDGGPVTLLLGGVLRLTVFKRDLCQKQRRPQSTRGTICIPAHVW